MVTKVQVWIFCLPQPQCVPRHPPGSLRNPHIELIITSQPLPSLILHILKLVEQSILHSMQIAVAEQSPQPLKVLSFSVFVLKKYRPAPRLHSTGLYPERCCMKIMFMHLRTHTVLRRVFELSLKLNWLFCFLVACQSWTVRWENVGEEPQQLISSLHDVYCGELLSLYI